MTRSSLQVVRKMSADNGSVVDTALTHDDLLGYYKDRVAAFDDERGELLQRIDTLGVDQRDLHRLEWENKQRSGEIWELQKALSSANEALFRERERLLKLQAENDELKHREEDDRKKIQYLLSLTNSSEQEITYLRHTKPESLALNSGAKVDKQGERTLRTVYLPTANADSLILRVESLQVQLNEQRQYSAERVEALLRDKRVREEQMSSHCLNYEQQIEIAGHKIQKLQDMLRNCTRDYILARRAKHEQEERAVTAEKLLQDRTKELTNKLQHIKERSAAQLHKIQCTTSDAIDEAGDKFRLQIDEKQSELTAMEKSFEVAKEQYESRVCSLESKVARLNGIIRQIEARRVQDLEGFGNEVSLLRKKLEVIDRRLHQMRLIERLGEDDRLDRMLQDIENKMPLLETEDGVYSLNLSSSPKKLAQEVQKIQSSLLGIEQKIRSTRRAASCCDEVMLR